ncbi:Coatomer, beta subunit [Rhizoclosmatium globosum]|uniref:Coatomer subunit beta n=1 Tax=Rhizoclosmatium globosum TaxID=329046 RepID=A0A1Y2CCX0_9FUNG|nr:coatomer subunit beta [Rhizoclosmatium hyalinum]KAJ3284659.1 coatomer subunit beta [Rhizoclosmatium sp. JEL0117]ORY44882.1 Coatomer, beta subunit [Rhizoclosmatium globosum]|eukprot:ORY44882.1 Coatomer, beta subunit [Rhizoclosmatium globosum]
MDFSIVAPDDDKDVPTAQDLRNQLEKGNDETKVDTMKRILRIMMNGDPLPSVLMHVIRFVLPSKSKTLKKLLLVYWEICPRLGADGKLKPEMRLMCHALRNDLQHPNEYIRGNTLRLLSKFMEDELLEPCVPPVRACLEHRHSYVRKNAILAIYSMYKNFEHLIPDAPELIYNYIQAEVDPNCKRNAFVMLMNTKQSLAVEYLASQYNAVDKFDEILQQAVIELIRKDCRSPTADKAKYIQCVFSLLQSSAPAVKYEAANTLMFLTSHSAAVKAAASCYIELIVKVSDNNVKLIVLDRLTELREKHDRILDDLVMDILRVLNSPDIDVRKKCLGIAMEMTSSRNVDEVVQFLKKELMKTQDGEYEKNNEYKQLLVHAIHGCAIKFSEVAASVVHVLMEFLGESGGASAVDVVAFVREVMEKFPQLRSGIIDQLIDSFKDMKTGRVYRGALWIMGEYTLDAPSIENSLRVIRETLGEVPILASEQRLLEEQLNPDQPVEQEVKSTPTLSAPAAQRRILADGTYATESAFSAVGQSKLEAIKASNKPPLRALILGGDYFVATSLAAALTKMALRYAKLAPHGNPKVNALRSEAMLIMTSIIRVGKSEFVVAPIDEDSNERINNCLRVLSGVYGETLNKVFLEDTRKAFTQLIHSSEKKTGKKEAKKVISSQADDLIVFRQLKGKKGGVDLSEAYDMDITKATGQDQVEDFASKLNRVVQLTGFSDPVYAEAYVTIHQYDILLDILIVNQTNETLQNLTLEFNTMGDLKLVERPTPQTIAPHGFHSIKANIKVSSTETGIIFGNIVYDGPSAVDVNCVILNDIHLDIMDYIKPATCTETQFRAMWTEFEWENKVNVNTNITDLHEYLKHIMKSTNMSCLTPEHALSGDCGFLAANLYARSIFGEDALANICLEMQQQGSSAITGHIRIRSKTQGIALSLGDKITLSQKLSQQALAASA